MDGWGTQQTVRGLRGLAGFVECGAHGKPLLDDIRRRAPSIMVVVEKTPAVACLPEPRRWPACGAVLALGIFWEDARALEPERAVGMLQGSLPLGELCPQVKPISVTPAPNVHIFISLNNISKRLPCLLSREGRESIAALPVTRGMVIEGTVTKGVKALRLYLREEIVEYHTW